jgi:hypothetical protein
MAANSAYLPREREGDFFVFFFFFSGAGGIRGIETDGKAGWQASGARPGPTEKWRKSP